MKDLILECGAMHVAPVKLSDIVFAQELRDMCDMNTCGNFATNWGCPPACGTMEELREKILSFSEGWVYQLVSQLEDSFDIEGMQRGAEQFAKVADELRSRMEQAGKPYLVLGAGGCSLCKPCTYPDEPCRQPERRNVSVEACGIYVSQLCERAGLAYINGVNTLTNTGLVLL